MATNDYLTKVVAEAIDGISRQMWARIEGDISGNDRLAMTAAIMRVAFETSRLTGVDAAAQVAESNPETQIKLAGQIEWTDPWEEAHGSEA